MTKIQNCLSPAYENVPVDRNSRSRFSTTKMKKIATDEESSVTKLPAIENVKKPNPVTPTKYSRKAGSSINRSSTNKSVIRRNNKITNMGGSERIFVQMQKHYVANDYSDRSSPFGASTVKSTQSSTNGLSNI